ncbi:MAG: type VI secretion system ImpA family N-terminal domain-containing protein [Gammaproteobacteria bacterium]
MSGAKAVAESIAIWRDLGSAPIPGDDPAGASARSENVFELLSEEVAKHESVTAGDVDWQAVVELSAVILSTRSKDLLVAVYFCRGVFSSHGYVGLSLGLQVLDDMVEHYWEVIEAHAWPLRRRDLVGGKAG